MLESIVELMKAMQQYHVDELVWEKDDDKIMLKASHPGRPAPQKVNDPDVVTPDDPMSGYDWSEIIESPVVGTYYAQASPNEPPFVEIGSVVEKGETICIVEAMKLLNEIVAPHSGVVIEIYAEDGQKVEYGQMLMRIKPREGE